MFTKVEDAQVVILDGPYERQVDVYERNGYLYAEVGKNKYLRLYADGRTLNPKIKVHELHCDEPLFRDALGRLGFANVRDAKALSTVEIIKLLAIEGGS